MASDVTRKTSQAVPQYLNFRELVVDELGVNDEGSAQLLDVAHSPLRLGIFWLPAQ
jgi:hypothetical protein